MRLALIILLTLLVSLPASLSMAASDICLPALAGPGRDRVSLSNIREGLIGSFRLKDADSDGRLTLDELMANASDVFQEMDVKSRGYVLLEDTLEYRCGKPKQGGAAKLYCSGITGDKSLYRLMDLNGDGMVDREECSAVWSVEFREADNDHDGKLTLVEFFLRQKQWFLRMDVNNDGVVTLDEFLNAQAWTVK